MPGKLFYLEDRRFHIANQHDFQELSVLPTDSGPHLVVAKGTVTAANVFINLGITLRLEVHGTVSGLIGFDETQFFTEPANIGPGGVVVTSGNPDRNSFMLVVAANIPFEGSGGIIPPPPTRAILLARTEGGSTGAAGVVSNVKITSFPLDEIVATVLT